MESANNQNLSGLTTGELTQLRERLERLRADLLARLASEQAVAREAEPLAEEMDAAEQTREQDDALMFTERDRARLSQIEKALAKFETGRYGLSEASGAPIGFRRLEAVPWTRLAADEAENGQ